MSQVLAITGRILPVTNADVQLEAIFDNGSSVRGESKIFAAKKEQNCRIHHVRLLPEQMARTWLIRATAWSKESEMPSSAASSRFPNACPASLTRA